MNAEELAQAFADEHRNILSWRVRQPHLGEPHCWFVYGRLDEYGISARDLGRLFLKNGAFTEPSSAKTKAELIQYLKESFDYSNAAVSQLTAANSLDRVDGRYAAPTTKLGISVASIWHVTDHYGQLVEYLRLNGVVPPLTQKYGIKVR